MRFYGIFIIAAGLVLASAASAEVQTPMVGRAVTFTENLGQWPDSVLFRAETGPVAMWFTPTGAYYQFTRRIGPMLSRDDVKRGPDSVEVMMVKAALVGGNPEAKGSGQDLTEYRCNFFLGEDADRWQSDVKNYERILLAGVYPGVDLIYRAEEASGQGTAGAQGRIEYDFHVAAGADYKQVRVRYEGATGLTIDSDGALVVQTAWGEIRELAPVVYQEAKGARTMVAAEFVLTGEREFGFRLGAGYDPTQPVVIDPVLVYGTFLGGSSRELGQGVAVDEAEGIYVTGTTYSADFPTAGAYDGTLGGNSDIFVTKFSVDGGSLVFSTYIGGSGMDYGWDMAVSGGAAYVTGQTFSTDFPTVNAWQTDPDISAGGASADGVVVKLAAAGSSLGFSTYVGGTNVDQPSAIAVGADGAAYVTGYTMSDDLPLVNEYQGFQGSLGYADAFVVSIPSGGGSAIYSTYIGGTGDDRGRGIAVDGTGAAYVTGYTQSTAFPTVNPYQTDQPNQDAFVVKITPGGGSLAYATYLGGNALDDGWGIAVDAQGNAYVTGRTQSSDFPTQNAFQTDQGGLDAFVTKLSAAGSSVVYSTYLGGSDIDEGWDIAVDAAGAAYVTGETYSSDFPVIDAYQTDQGMVDAFVTKVAPTGSVLQSSTYLGGQMNDQGTGIALDAGRSIYVTGFTYSDDFPTAGAYQGTRDSVDLFVVKFDLGCCTGIRGNADGDANENINVADVSLLIAAIFRGGPLPACFEEGDVNGDGNLNVSDVSSLIATIFRGAPLPPPCP